MSQTSHPQQQSEPQYWRCVNPDCTVPQDCIPLSVGRCFTTCPFCGVQQDQPAAVTGLRGENKRPSFTLRPDTESCSGDLRSMKNTKDTMESVQMKNILQYGTYRVGFKNSAHTVHDLVSLTLAGNSHKLDKIRYTLDELQDLESKLMLISGNKTEAGAEVDHYINLLHSAINIAEIYMNLQRAGDVTYSTVCLHFKCAVYEVEQRGSHRRGFNKDKAKKRVSDLQEYTRKLEAHLVSWKTTVDSAREKYCELNYFTTKQLLKLRKELGQLLKHAAATSSVKPSILMLLKNISPGIPSSVVSSSLQVVCFEQKACTSDTQTFNDCPSIKTVVRQSVDRTNPVVRKLVNEGFSSEAVVEAAEMFRDLQDARNFLNTMKKEGFKRAKKLLESINREKFVENIEVDETVILEQHDADTSVNYLELHKLGEVLHDISLKLPEAAHRTKSELHNLQVTPEYSTAAVPTDLMSDLKQRLQATEQRAWDAEQRERDIQHQCEDAKEQLKEAQKRIQEIITKNQKTLQSIEQRAQLAEQQLQDTLQQKQNTEHELRGKSKQLLAAEQRAEHAEQKIRMTQRLCEDSVKQLKIYKKQSMEAKTKMQDLEAKSQEDILRIEQKAQLTEKHLQDALRQKQYELEDKSKQLRAAEQRTWEAEQKAKVMEYRCEKLHKEFEQHSAEANRKVWNLTAKNQEIKTRAELVEQQLQDTIHQKRDIERELEGKTKELAAHSTEVWRIPPRNVSTVRRIGTGGWGAVLEGQIKVAVKELHQEIASPHNIKKVQREMKLLAEVRHPNLVQFVGAVLDQPLPLIITELLDINLRQAYQENRLRPGDRLMIFIDIGRALDYLHQRYEPIIHRDVSAPNVLLQQMPNNQWKGKVSDLGSANFLQDAQTKGEGCILYSPPEMIPRAFNPRRQRIPQTTKIDVYSYGVLLCEVITSRFPSEENYFEMLESVHRSCIKAHTLIKHCTQERPDDRPTMAAVLAKLCHRDMPRL